MTLAPRQPVVGGWGKMGRAGFARRVFRIGGASSGAAVARLLAAAAHRRQRAREQLPRVPERAAARVGAAGGRGDAQQLGARQRGAQGAQDAGRRAADDAQQPAGRSAPASRRSRRPSPSRSASPSAVWPRLRPGRPPRQATSPAGGRRGARKDGLFVIDQLDAAAAARAAHPHRRAQPARRRCSELCDQRAGGGRHPLARAAAGGLARSHLHQDLRQGRRRVRVGGVGAARAHAERPAAAQARARLAHHRPRGGRRLPVHQLRARRGDAPRAHGPALSRSARRNGQGPSRRSQGGGRSCASAAAGSRRRSAATSRRSRSSASGRRARASCRCRAACSTTGPPRSPPSTPPSSSS